MTRAFIIFVFAACLPGAELKLPPGLEPIARLALSTPPEFASDGLLQLLESRKIEDRETQIDLAQQAFDLAAAAHFRVALRPIAGIGGDTRQAFLAKAYALRLDTVSLQSRAVMAMLPLDKTRARQMFQSMVKPELPALRCEDVLVYDPAAYYRALAAVAQTGFTVKERAKEDHVAFMLEYVGQVHSASQLAPMITALLSSGLGPAETEAVAVRLEGQMEAIAGDYRSFSATLDDIGKAVTPDMSLSFRKYVDKNQAVPACPAAKPDSFWQSEAAKRILAGASTLRFTHDRSRVLSDAERATPEWQQQLADFEKDLNAWQVSDETSEADYYNQKSMVYQALVELIPPGPGRDNALQAFIAFIGGSNLQSQSPVEWFTPAEAMLQRVRNTGSGEPAKVLAAFESSGNPVLALYAAMERTFDRSTPWFVKRPS